MPDRTMDIRVCDRCGWRHDAIEVKPLYEAIEVGGVLFVEWVLCPTNDAPVLIATL